MLKKFKKTIYKTFLVRYNITRLKHMADVVKWLTQLVVVQSFRGFDSHRPPHIYQVTRIMLSMSRFFILLKIVTIFKILHSS